MRCAVNPRDALEGPRWLTGREGFQGRPVRSGAHTGHRGAHVRLMGGFGSDKPPPTAPAGYLDALEGLVGVLRL